MYEPSACVKKAVDVLADQAEREQFVAAFHVRTKAPLYFEDVEGKGCPFGLCGKRQGTVKAWERYHAFLSRLYSEIRSVYVKKRSTELQHALSEIATMIQETFDSSGKLVQGWQLRVKDLENLGFKHDNVLLAGSTGSDATIGIWRHRQFCIYHRMTDRVIWYWSSLNPEQKIFSHSEPQKLEQPADFGNLFRLFRVPLLTWKVQGQGISFVRTNESSNSPLVENNGGSPEGPNRQPSSTVYEPPYTAYQDE